MMQRTTLRKSPEPVVEADATGIFHVFLAYDEERDTNLEHAISEFCYCFPEPRWNDEKGNRMMRPVYIHRIFPHRGNA